MKIPASSSRRNRPSRTTLNLAVPFESTGAALGCALNLVTVVYEPANFASCLCAGPGFADCICGGECFPLNARLHALAAKTATQAAINRVAVGDFIFSPRQDVDSN